MSSIPLPRALFAGPDLEGGAVSPAMREAIAAASDVAPTPTTVLLLGESGTGKELMARHIHARSQRASGPWVAVNCAALPAELLESELFGHERGAFTGAAERHTGRFELADGGTLLLDEISELPLNLQAKLLRALQEREVDRIGGHRPVSVDVRVIATSNRDLQRMVAQGLFRSDLFYRINVFPIVVPPLRQRREDLPYLTHRLLAETSEEMGRTPPALAPDVLPVLMENGFPGNVRELRNILEGALVRCRGDLLEARHLGSAMGEPPRAPLAPGRLPDWLPIDLSALERLAILEALRRVNGNRTHAARLLGIGLRTLRNKLRAWRESGLSFDLQPVAGGEQPADLAARRLLPGQLRSAVENSDAAPAELPARSSQKEWA